MSASPDDIRAALSHVPAGCGRDLWTKMGMAVKSELGDSGRDIWMRWSESSDSYRERDAISTWKSIGAAGGITIRSLFREALDRGWTPSTEHTARAASCAPRTTRPEPLDWSTRAESIWRRTQGLRGTLGETYLRHRGCALPPRDSHLRYLPGDGHHPPSLCAAVTDIVTAQPISLHFTRLAADGKGKAGTERDKTLLAGHRKRGGCIRLWPDDAVTHGLALAEGAETALAAAHLYSPIWAAIDAGNLAAFPLLAGIETLVIYADHDDAGLKAARECAMRWKDREVRIVRSRTAGHDIADEVAA